MRARMDMSVCVCVCVRERERELFVNIVVAVVDVVAAFSCNRDVMLLLFVVLFVVSTAS